MLQDNSLQLEATIYHCVVQWMQMKLIRMMQNANFPNFRTTFKAQVIRILGKMIIYSRSLLTQDHVHVFVFRFHQVLRKLEFPPGNNVSDKPLTPLDVHHSGDQFDINFMFVR